MRQPDLGAMIHCPICDSDAVSVFLEGETQDLSSESIGQSRATVVAGAILECAACGHGFSELRPSEAQLARLYAEQDTEVYSAESDGRRKTARRHLHTVERYCRGGRLLDVGCATGQFIEIAADEGWEVVGVEPSPAQSAAARTALGDTGEVVCATLSDAQLPAGSFEVVTLWDVLEHVVDPVRFLGECASHLSEMGRLFVNVPRLDSVVARMLGARWPLLLPEHLNYFTRRSLSLCGEKAGLELIRFGHRPAYYSVGYVLERLGQHRIPGCRTAAALSRRFSAGNWLIPVRQGEILAVWAKR